jgi:hypothetical protein
LEVLENETHMRVSHQRSRIFIHHADRFARETHRPARRLIEPGAQPEQRRLPAPTRPNDRHARSGANGETHLVQYGQRTSRGGIRFGQSLDFQHVVITH